MLHPLHSLTSSGKLCWTAKANMMAQSFALKRTLSQGTSLSCTNSIKHETQVAAPHTLG